MALLQVDNLSKSYNKRSPDHAVLQRLHLQLSPGERVAILGRSGCGKSTLLNLIAGLEQPDSGQILLNGEALHTLSDTERTLRRRRHIGFIFQFFNLVPTLTALENVMLPLELNGTDNLATGARLAEELLTRLGLGELGSRYPEQLSGGEQQRLAIARALIHKPALLLADEPTGNLDQETGNAVAELLFNSIDCHSALLMVTHSEEIASHADRVLRLQQGQLVSAEREFSP